MSSMGRKQSAVRGIELRAHAFVEGGIELDRRPMWGSTITFSMRERRAGASGPKRWPARRSPRTMASG